MKNRLFIKILAAFWLTFMLITQAVWLLFEMKRQERSPPERLLAEAVAPATLAAGTQAVQQAGERGFETLRAQLPADYRNRVSLRRMDGEGDAISPLPPDGNWKESSTLARAPDGSEWRIAFRYFENERSRWPLNTPPEMLVVGLLGGLLFSVLLALYLTRPIFQLQRGFDSLAKGELGVRLEPAIGQRRDEIADLGRDFDHMAQRLQQLVETRERMLHQVSHELRSPLTRLQLAVALGRKSPEAVDRAFERIERETARLETMVNELLTLARAESAQTSGDDYFDLIDIIASVAEDARFEAQTHDIAIEQFGLIESGESQSPVKGSAELIRRALDNILRNAVRFSPPGSTITISTSFDRDSDAYLVAIADEGPGIGEEDVAAIFEPFVRTANAGIGFGLGLAIARRAILAHGGDLQAENIICGGLKITISLPIAKN